MMLRTLLSDFRFRLRALFRRASVEREMDDELRFHIEQEASKYVRAGDSPDEASLRDPGSVRLVLNDGMRLAACLLLALRVE